MARLSKAEIEARRKRMSEEALENIANRGVLEFKLDPKDIKRLHAVASRDKKSMGSLIREYVIQGLITDENLKD